ncbi:MAG: hypothetical protein IPL35_15330 [Sphingobacteriales bacterium]|nr:hypothetical protein [Sphingobacteriales bacterium]
MIGDIIDIKPEYHSTAAQLLTDMERKQLLKDEKGRVVVLIAGESGSGKSVTAHCLANLLNSSHRYQQARILHLDDYFYLPPRSNHQQREADLNRVGTQEVNLPLLQQHLDAFLQGRQSIMRPIMDYAANEQHQNRLFFGKASYLIIEGTYSFRLRRAQYHIFMERTYLDTYEQRKKRGRDILSPFVEKVLAIEHPLIAATKTSADALVRKDYSVVFMS